MPNESDTTTARRQRIVQILGRAPVTSQADLVERLHQAGFTVTQASVSRDLQALGVTKEEGIYRLPAPLADAAPLGPVARFIRRLSPAGSHLLVVHTTVGTAPAVALAIDSARWPEIVGTIAGDDTIFIATPTAAAQKRLRQRLR